MDFCYTVLVQMVGFKPYANAIFIFNWPDLQFGPASASVDT